MQMVLLSGTPSIRGHDKNVSSHREIMFLLQYVEKNIINVSIETQYKVNKSTLLFRFSNKIFFLLVLHIAKYCRFPINYSVVTYYQFWGRFSQTIVSWTYIMYIMFSVTDQIPTPTYCVILHFFNPLHNLKCHLDNKFMSSSKIYLQRPGKMGFDAHPLSTRMHLCFQYSKTWWLWMLWCYKSPVGSIRQPLSGLMSAPPPRPTSNMSPALGWQQFTDHMCKEMGFSYVAIYMC